MVYNVDNINLTYIMLIQELYKLQAVCEPLTIRTIELFPKFVTQELHWRPAADLISKIKRS